MPRDNTARGILVVDEDRRSADALVVALVARGYTVSAAYGAAEASAALEAKRRNLVVVDLKTPAHPDLLLAFELRERFDVPLLFLASAADQETVRQASALGAIAFLVKPPDVIQCIPTIETALARAEELWGLRLRAAQLSLAVQESRTTSVAIGILMERLRLDREAAFETLRGNSRSRRRSVTDVAEQLVGSAEALNQVLHSGSRPP